MTSVNKAVLVGNVGRDLQLRKTDTSGETVTNFSLVTEEQWGTEGKVTREWHRITLYGEIAVKAVAELKSGDLVYVSGRLKTDKHSGENGVLNFSTDIIADEFKRFPIRLEDQRNARKK